MLLALFVVLTTGFRAKNGPPPRRWPRLRFTCYRPAPK
jgi:hypothetical protein